MTAIGLILLILCIVCLFLPMSYLVALTIIVSVSQVSSVITIGGSGLVLQIFTLFFVIIKTCLMGKFRIDITDKLTFLFLVFTLYSVIISIIGPILFSGVRIMYTSLDDSYLNGNERLHAGMINIGQFFTFLIRVVGIICIWNCRKIIDNKIIKNSFIISVLIAVAFGFWEFSAKWFGIWFPTAFLFNNPGVGITVGELWTAMLTDGETMRMSSLCSEASYFGVFLAASFWSFMVLKLYGCYKYFSLFLILLAMVLTLSGGGFVTLALGSLIYFYFMPKSPILISSLVFILLIFCFVYSLDSVQDLLSSKSDSQSGEVRLGTSINSLLVCLKSLGLGIGWCYTRSSSFLCDTLAAVGVFGTFILLNILYVLYSNAYNRSGLYIFMYSAVLMIGQITTVPDFRFNFFWLSLIMLASYSNDNSIALKLMLKELIKKKRIDL